MLPPVEPKKEDCCNNGCCPCIFDVYKKQLQLYERYLEGDENIANPEDNGISQLEYNTFEVVDNIDILHNSHHILALKALNNKKVRWKPGNYFLLKYSFEGNSYIRAYTPVKIKVKTKEKFEFTVIIKKYDNSVVSNYLCNLKPGSLTLWRGPYGDYEIVQNKFSRIIMIAQGTGIAPFFSIIDYILQNEDDMTKIILVYCCQNIDTIIFREELYTFKAYWNFEYYIYLCNVIQNQVCKYKEPILYKRFSVKEFDNFLPFCKNDQFLLCGSSQFLEEYNIWLINKCNILPDNIKLF